MSISQAGGPHSPSFSLLEDLQHLSYSDNRPDFKVGIVFDREPDPDMILDGITAGLDLVVKVNNRAYALYVRELDYDVGITEYYEGLTNCQVVLVSKEARISELRACQYKGLIYPYWGLQLI